jgi:hydrogenase expression/formation protein HypC
MCLGIPGLIVEVVDTEQQLAKVDVSGIRRTVNIALLDGQAGVGDWVLIHVGFAMSVINEQHTLETRAFLEQLGGPYDQELDELRSSAIE